jgi:hypothetical protein
MIKLAISEGNTKLGNTPNLNLPPGPGGTCRKDALCWTSGTCYARKAWKQYPNVREAWARNWNLWKKDAASFEKQLNEYLTKKKPQRFRWHSGGDIPDQEYFAMVERVAKRHGATHFLVFTKRYELNLEHDARNLSVMYSRWPGMDFPEHLKDKPQAHFEDGDVHTYDTVDDFVVCPGSCKDCSSCWHSCPVLFQKH